MKKRLFFSVVAFSIGLYSAALLWAADTATPPFMANGVKVGEVTDSEAILWVRLTRDDGTPSIQDAAPGMAGEVRVAYWPEKKPDDQTTIDWLAVAPEKDFTVQVRLKSLSQATRYCFRVETRRGRDVKLGQTLEGSFLTAPDAQMALPVRAVVVTCQHVSTADAGDNGFATYHYMGALRPDFFVHTGDIVYYDRTPTVHNVAEARMLWNRTFAYRFNREFHRNVTSYFEKDDHDTLKDDCVPGDVFNDMTFAEGQMIFREQVPMGEKTYRTFRWGKDLQIWLTENRDFRTHKNNAPDSPEKSILGKEQRDWLMRTMKESDATFKLLILPGCIVGPDKARKKDNHSNETYHYEGSMLRSFLASLGNAYVVNGDRHWQYHSIDPETGLHEFGCGPINDLHMNGGNCGYQPAFHQYFCEGGGFLEIVVERKKAAPSITFRYHGVNGVCKPSEYEPREVMTSSSASTAENEKATVYPPIRYEKTFDSQK